MKIIKAIRAHFTLTPEKLRARQLETLRLRLISAELLADSTNSDLLYYRTAIARLEGQRPILVEQAKQC
jgi:hypothetical protein